MDFNAIPGAFPRAFYTIDVEWRGLERWLAQCTEEGLDPCPDYQREHVWTEAQQALYVEYMLRGGEVSRVLIINAPKWTPNGHAGATLLDGKQRLEAVRRFLRNDLPIFGGHRFKDFTGYLRATNARFHWSVVALSTELETLDLYLSINAGGTPHTDVEIARIRARRDFLAGGGK